MSTTVAFENTESSVVGNATSANVVRSKTDCTLYGTPGFKETTSPAKGSSGAMLVCLVVVPNLLVILCMVWSMHRSRNKLSVPKLIILSLATADLCYGLVSMLTQTMRHYRGFCATGGQTTCIAQAFFANVLSVMSILLVVLMSSERYCALRFPFKHDQYFSVMGTIKIIGALLAYAILQAFLPVLGVNNYGLGQYGCDYGWDDTSPDGRGYVYFRVLQVAILLVLILSLNCCSCYEVIKMQAKVAPAPQGAGDHGNADQALQNSFMVLTILASITSIICNGPYPVRLVQIQMKISKPPVPIYVIKRMFISNSIVNPFLMLIFYASTAVRGCTNPFGKKTNDNSSVSTVIEKA